MAAAIRNARATIRFLSKRVAAQGARPLRPRARRSSDRRRVGRVRVDLPWQVLGLGLSPRSWAGERPQNLTPLLLSERKDSRLNLARHLEASQRAHCREVDGEQEATRRERDAPARENMLACERPQDRCEEEGNQRACKQEKHVLIFLDDELYRAPQRAVWPSESKVGCQEGDEHGAPEREEREAGRAEQANRVRGVCTHEFGWIAHVPHATVRYILREEHRVE